MNPARSNLVADPFGAAGFSLMLGMSAVMCALSFATAEPVPAAAKVVIMAGEFVGVGLVLLAAVRLRRQGRTLP